MGIGQNVRFWQRAGMAVAALAVGLVLIAGCGPFGFDKDGVQFSSAEYGVTASPRITRSMRVEKGGGRYVLGDPYRVAGRWYTPADDPNYEATGMASWYGSNFHGRLTANGEIYDMNGISGAHPTLPLPSYVRVTNLENGRSIVVRVNDRGPYTHGRVIDVSQRAADLLGFRTAGTARVRVNYFGPAALEGDDTRALLATYSGPGVTDQPNFSVASVQPRRARGGFFRRLVDGTLFSYAEDGDRVISEAHAAANAMAAGTLADWQRDFDLNARTPNLTVGVFANASGARDVALTFARLAAVSLHPATAGGQPATEVRLDTLKPGVTQADVLNLAGELGLTDIVLY